jgi:hypothetical protein
MLLACGGATTTSRSLEAGSEASAPIDSGAGPGDDAASDSGCPQPPSEPTYDCDAAVPDAGTCGPWESTESSPRYPVGCVVTTTMEGSFCGPVTCNCMTVPPSGPPGWTCPL